MSTAWQLRKTTDREGDIAAAVEYLKKNGLPYTVTDVLTLALRRLVIQIEKGGITENGYDKGNTSNKGDGNTGG